MSSPSNCQGVRFQDHLWRPRPGFLARSLNECAFDEGRPGAAVLVQPVGEVRGIGRGVERPGEGLLGGVLADMLFALVHPCRSLGYEHLAFGSAMPGPARTTARLAGDIGLIRPRAGRL